MCLVCRCYMALTFQMKIFPKDLAASHTQSPQNKILLLTLSALLKLCEIPFGMRELMPRVLACCYTHLIKNIMQQPQGLPDGIKCSYLLHHLGKVSAVCVGEPCECSGERCQGGAVAHDEDDTWHSRKSKELVRELQHCHIPQQQMGMGWLWGCSSF